MQNREKILAVLLAAALGIGVIVPRIWNAYQEPLIQGKVQIDQLDTRIDSAVFDQHVADAKLRKMVAWKKQSLPPNPQNAMLFYQQWLTDLAETVARFRNVSVSPVRLQPSRDGTYTTVRVKVAGEAPLERIRNFLFAFYRTDLLQHIVNINIENRKREDNADLVVSITAEGLSLPDAPLRVASLFPRTTLANDLDEKSTTLTVQDSTGFPKKGSFQVRVDGELLNVVTLAGNDWTVERGAEDFAPASHQQDTVVEFVPVSSSMQGLALSDYDELITLNPFTKPHEKTVVEEPNQAPTIASIEPKTVAPGETLTFTASASDPETPADQLVYKLADGAPEGAWIDLVSGEFTWTPARTTPPGDHRITIQAADDAAQPLVGSCEVTVTVTEDAGQYIFLTAAISADDRAQAWLYDRATNRRVVLAEGRPVKYAGVNGSVVEIGRDYVVLEIGADRWKLGLGQNLHSLVKLPGPDGKAPKHAVPKKAAEERIQAKTPSVSEAETAADPDAKSSSEPVVASKAKNGDETQIKPQSDSDATPSPRTDTESPAEPPPAASPSQPAPQPEKVSKQTPVATPDAKPDSTPSSAI